MSIIDKLGITPGPWRHSEGMGKIFAHRIGGCQMKLQNMNVADVRGWGCLQYLGHDKAIAEQKANEYLIAAAPEMLEALIESLMKAEEMNDLIQQFDPESLEEIYKTDKRILAVEKASGKTWEEIKEITK